MKKIVRSFSWIALAVVLTLGGGVAAAAAPQATAQAPAVQARAALDAMSQAFEAAAAKVSPSVVSIFAEKVVQADNQLGMPDDPFRDFFGDQFFRRFFGDPSQGGGQRRTVRGLGSGVIVSPDGLILTNNHVVEKADKLSVVVGDNKKSYPAKVIGTDPATDVAVIRINAKDLPAAALGDSDGVRVGEWVLAVGNPFELMRSVTAGIISAKGRSSVGLADYEDFIQTDASINPGNSGGALADLDGRVVGINTAITTGPSGGSIGIGFAIPINMARKVMDTLITKGEVVRGYLGVTLQPIDENMAQALELKGTDGALVGDVVAGGPADKAGIERGDVVLSVDGRAVRDSIEVRNLVADGQPGKSIAIGLLRDGKRLERKVVLGERPRERNGEESGGDRQTGSSQQKLGLSVRDLTPDIAQQLGYNKNEKGAVVAEVVPGSAADDAGLQAGDLIQEINRVPVRSARDLERIAHGLRAGDAIALLVRRGDGTLFLSLKVQ
jgi:serine protease Do